MKYITPFNNIKHPKVGDYVICTDFRIEEESLNFIENNIGTIVGLSDYTYSANPYRVKYDNTPNKNLDFDEGSRYFSREEILYFSKNKEDLESIINAKKYNL